MGMRFHHGDEKFKRFMDLTEEGFKLFSKVTAANYIPILRLLPCIHDTRNKIAQNRLEMVNFFQVIIDQHRATYKEGTIRDIIDTYLFEIEQAKKEGREHELFQGKDKGEQKLIFSNDTLILGLLLLIYKRY